MKKIIAVILSVCLAIVILSVCLIALFITFSASSENAANQSPDEIATIQFSDGIVTATLDKESGVLTFSGNGAVDNTCNWLKLQEKAYVKEVVFEEGITSIGSCEFNNLYPNLAKVTFNGDINAIGSCAFSSNPNLEEVIFNGKCKAIEDLVFFNCYSLTNANVPDDCNVKNAFSGTPLEKTTDASESPTTNNNETIYYTPAPPVIYSSEK